MHRMIFSGVFVSVLLLILAAQWLNSADISSSEPDQSISSQYPAEVQKWNSYIVQYAIKYQLDADLVAALIWYESGGDPYVYSNSGAVGLMQIMPKDGIASAFLCDSGPCFANRPTMAELYNPEFNIDFGCEMLSGMLYRYGDMREALKAYGPVGVGYDYADLVLSIYENHRARE